MKQPKTFLPLFQDAYSAMNALNEQAEKENLRTINGLDMLIFQVKIGFENWFLQKPSYTFELKKMLENSIKS